MAANESWGTTNPLLAFLLEPFLRCDRLYHITPLTSHFAGELEALSHELCMEGKTSPGDIRRSAFLPHIIWRLLLHGLLTSLSVGFTSASAPTDASTSTPGMARLPPVGESRLRLLSSKALPRAQAEVGKSIKATSSIGH